MSRLSKPEVLVLSGYHAASHRYWCEQLMHNLQDFNWTLISLPDRHFYWRIRSNALAFSHTYREVLDRQHDLLLATSMVDLCNLRGLLPHLSSVPSILYFHENQFVYPDRTAPERNELETDASDRSAKRSNAQLQQRSNLINAQLTSVYSALSADKLVFNSAYNRDSFINGAQLLLQKMPDGPSDFIDDLALKSLVIPVPVRATGDDSYHGKTASRLRHANQPVEIIWNHRWEYDKQPQVFFDALSELINSGVNCKVHVMGQSFRQVPECFDEFRQHHCDSILTWGYQSAEVYRRILQQAHIVVSSALHDFQGLGMLEAIAAGCTPVAPDRMAYPEYIPEALLYRPASNDVPESQLLCQKLLSVIANAAQTCGTPTDSTLAGSTGITDTQIAGKQIDVTQYLHHRVMPAYASLVRDSLVG